MSLFKNEIFITKNIHYLTLNYGCSITTLLKLAAEYINLRMTFEAKYTKACEKNDLEIAKV